MQLVTRAWSVIAVLVLGAVAAGCLKAGKPAAPDQAGEPEPEGPVVVESTSVAAQSELAAQYSPEPTDYVHCAVAEEKRMQRGTGPHKLAIQKTHIVAHDDEGRTSDYDIDDWDDIYKYPTSALDDRDAGQKVILLLDGRIYGARSHGSGYRYEVEYVCAQAAADVDAMLRKSWASHSAEVKEYMTRRHHWRQAAKAEAAAARVAARDEAQDEALVRARTMESITVTAGGNSPDEDIWIEVTARLADGSTLVIRDRDRIFGELFGYSYLPGRYEFIVEVTAKDDPSIRAETGEVGFAFAGERDFECAGEIGAIGLDLDAIGAKNYHGRRGQDGPDITVEIADTGARTPDDHQILRYRLTCGAQTKVFNAGARARVRVASYGGKGGHAIPGPKGEGKNGGNGGDGGDITLVVDPDVASYNVVTVTVPGDGGNASDRAQTNDSDEGTPGKRGSPGYVSTRRAPVSIP